MPILRTSCLVQCSSSQTRLVAIVPKRGQKGAVSLCRGYRLGLGAGGMGEGVSVNVRQGVTMREVLQDPQSWLRPRPRDMGLWDRIGIYPGLLTEWKPNVSQLLQAPLTSVSMLERS